MYGNVKIFADGKQKQRKLQVGSSGGKVAFSRAGVRGVLPGAESAVSAVRFLVRNRCRRWAQESSSRGVLFAKMAVAAAATVNTSSSPRTEAGGGARHSRSGAPMARHAPTIARTRLADWPRGERRADSNRQGCH